MNVPGRDPQMVAWEALREQQFSPREAARAGDIVVVGALRAVFDLTPKKACGCGPSKEEQEFAATGERLLAMPLDDFNALCQELYEKGEGGV